jgi:hypothetical protein
MGYWLWVIGYWLLKPHIAALPYVGLIALRAFCLATPPFGHPSKGGEWAAQGSSFI